MFVNRMSRLLHALIRLVSNAVKYILRHVETLLNRAMTSDDCIYSRKLEKRRTLKETRLT